MPTIAETLAAYAADERTAPLSAEVRHHARRALIDWFAALLPGAQLAPATLLADALDGDVEVVLECAPDRVFERQRHAGAGGAWCDGHGKGHGRLSCDGLSRREQIGGQPQPCLRRHRRSRNKNEQG